MTAYTLTLIVWAAVILAVLWSLAAIAAMIRESARRDGAWTPDRLPRPVQTRGDLIGGSTYDDYRDKWQPVDPAAARRIRDDIDVALWNAEMSGEDA